jgi:group I intron endonuclease
MKEKICGIYKVTNTINGKVYIGQSIDIYSRWNHHKTCCDNEKCHEYNSPFYRALRKYGLDNFTFEVIERCSVNELDYKEIYYIQKYNSFVQAVNSNGYNNAIGGNQGSRFRKKSEEEKRKISENRDYKIGSENPLSKTVLYKENEYGSIQELIDKENFNENVGTIRCWLNGNNSMPQKYYDNGLMYKNESDKRIRRKSNSWELRITWLDGKQFKSASECSKYCGIKDKVLRSYLSRSRRMPKELYDRGLRYNDYSMNDYEYFQK